MKTRIWEIENELDTELLQILGKSGKESVIPFTKRFYSRKIIEIIEKLIADIPDGLETAEDYADLEPTKQQLRDKWL